MNVLIVLGGRKYRRRQRMTSLQRLQEFLLDPRLDGLAQRGRSNSSRIIFGTGLVHQVVVVSVVTPVAGLHGEANHLYENLA